MGTQRAQEGSIEEYTLNHSRGSPCNLSQIPQLSHIGACQVSTPADSTRSRQMNHCLRLSLFDWLGEL